jgi:hypothetical protein
MAGGDAERRFRARQDRTLPWVCLRRGSFLGTKEDAKKFLEMHYLKDWNLSGRYPRSVNHRSQESDLVRQDTQEDRKK